VAILGYLVGRAPSQGLEREKSDVSSARCARSAVPCARSSTAYGTNDGTNQPIDGTINVAYQLELELIQNVQNAPVQLSLELTFESVAPDIAQNTATPRVTGAVR